MISGLIQAGSRAWHIDTAKHSARFVRNDCKATGQQAVACGHRPRHTAYANVPRVHSREVPFESKDGPRPRQVGELKVLSSGIIPLLLIFSVIGSFFSGLTSLVESSALGALASFVVALLRRRLTWSIFKKILRETLDNSAMFMWIMMAALAFAAVFDGLGAVRALEGLFMNDLGLSPWQILLMMQISFIILGIFLNDTAMLVIVAPLYIPLVVKLGFDPIWFGVLYTITCQIAYLLDTIYS